jgi:hypothetical protein
LDLKDHLRRQLGFLELSADAFDRGYHDEGVRIAVAIRALLHETARSTPLLAHLNAFDVPLTSTAPLLAGPPPLFADLLTMLSMPGGIRPTLGRAQTAFELPAREWWSQMVYAVDRKAITRKDLVLAAANKDGGAHVDPALSADYVALHTFWTLSDDAGETRDGPVHLVGLRQLAWELLNSPQLAALAR